jgi:SAM-dependent methyltransferase
MQAVKEFYSKLQFPGPYTIDDLNFYSDNIINDYLKIFDGRVKQATRVLDVGCGSGFIVNFLANRYPDVIFDAVDFSDSIDFSRQFSIEHNINNINYYKEDFLVWNTDYKYDLIISNGVLHHIPEYQRAIDKIYRLTTDKVIIGIYNSYGKLLKKISKINYVNETLYLDQEQCPFELAFTDKEFKKLFNKYDVLTVYPSYCNRLVDFRNLFNSSNGGLTVYVFQKNC